MNFSLPDKLHDKLREMDARRAAIENEMAQPGRGALRALSAEYGKLLPLTDAFRAWREARRKLGELREMERDSAGGELAKMAGEECKKIAADGEALQKELRRLAAPESENDGRGCFLEIRAAAGGEESGLFAGALFRMYCRYAEAQKWKTEIISQSANETGGCKETVSRVSGRGAFGRLKYESGAHRVQRVPETESQGRVHTSVATVAVLPEALPEDNIELSPADLRVETFRSSGAGGQHVNTTDSAVRVTHLPSGIVAECQDGRSQHKNRERALNVLRARIAEQKRCEARQKTSETRRALVGSGERSERIRTYNFPQGRITDHRIGLTLYKLPAVMEGELDEVLDALADADGG
ncbi:MAG: peptide chain release factor 1 [Gammaproteobacteria bacterium]